jgi:hypothetical protein
MSLKGKFTEAFKNQLILANEDTSDLEVKIWYNLRNRTNSLRLTDVGIELIQKIDLRLYEIELPKDFKMSAQILIWLDRFLESPYHLNNKKITVITEKAAMEMYLFSGDLQKYGLSKSINKRLAQD